LERFLVAALIVTVELAHYYYYFCNPLPACPPQKGSPKEQLGGKNAACARLVAASPARKSLSWVELDTRD